MVGAHKGKSQYRAPLTAGTSTDRLFLTLRYDSSFTTPKIVIKTKSGVAAPTTITVWCGGPQANGPTWPVEARGGKHEAAHETGELENGEIFTPALGLYWSDCHWRVCGVWAEP